MASLFAATRTMEKLIDWRDGCVTDEQLTPREYSYFDEYMEKVYTDSDCAIAPFWKSLRV